MKSSFKRAAVMVMGIATLFTALAAGNNIYKSAVIDNLDPVGRVMTTGEIEMAREIFADTIDYSRVRIHKAPPLGDLAATDGNHIYMQTKPLHSADLSAETPGKQKFLGHELTHIWQDNHYNFLQRAWQAVVMLPSRVKYLLTGETNAYNYTSSGKKSFDALNREQQAAMVADYIEAKETLENPAFGHLHGYAQKRVDTLQPVLQKTLPLQAARR